MKDLIGAAIAIIVVVGFGWWGVASMTEQNDAMRAEYAKKREDFFAQMKRDKCLRTGFAGKYAVPVWTCPDGMSHKEP